MIEKGHLLLVTVAFLFGIAKAQSFLPISFDSAGTHGALEGQLGLSLASTLGQPTETCDPGESDRCYEWGDFARLYLTDAKETNDNCATVEWYSPYARRLEDCFDLQDGVHWYGGGSKWFESWPIETVARKEAPMVSGSSEYTSLVENYWIISSAVALHVDETTPLFFSINSTRLNQACLVAEDKFPYKNRGEIRLKYDVCLARNGETMKEVHLRAIKKYYALPTGTPDLEMLMKPFWSTWAEYKMDVNQSVVLQLANDLVSNGLEKSSHIEIDDKWEICYGQYEFDLLKFPDPMAMTQTLKSLGFRTTLWTHPFINIDCPAYKVALENGYLVKDERGVGAMTSWWQGNNAGIVDFTNKDAVEWWSGRLKALQTNHGIDSFKFDAGEFNMLPPNYQFSSGNPLDYPNYYTTAYIEAAAKFGGLIEVRSARRNQNQPIFLRMLDKDSRWGYDNGLQSLIPTLLDYSIKGYSFVMPDMIGGNAYGDGWYGDRPAQQLFIRWMQANAFMPAVQFSVLPFHYDAETMDIVRGTLALREKYQDKILEATQQVLVDGTPMNRPMWWADPLDTNTLTIDDQYMLGDDILVAPVVRENATTRDIYLPQGRWTIQLETSQNVTYDGPLLLDKFPVPINFLPFFIRENEDK